MDETNALLREILQELKKLTAKQEVTRAKRAVIHSSKFPEFWEAYPRAKAGKLSAEKAYEKAIGVDSHDSIMAGVERFARELKKSPKDTHLIPLASSWLNAGRLMDEDEEKPKEKKEVKDLQAYSDPVEKEKENQRKLADEWTDKKIAELTQDEILAIKRGIMVKWPEAIKLKPSLGVNFYRAEVRKTYGCPYSR